MKKGAFVEFMSAFGTSVPNVIVFQYNPETVRHAWSQPLPTGAQPGQPGSNPLAVSGEPGETYSFNLSMDATDMHSDLNPLVRLGAIRHGIYQRLAALEMLLYPATGSRSGGGGGGGGSGEKRPTPSEQVPAVLFVWGSSRIVPVRVTSLSITEKLYDAELNPTHADAQIELRVLTPTELQSVPGALGRIARQAYKHSQNQREQHAAANLGDTARAVIGMLGDKNLLG